MRTDGQTDRQTDRHSLFVILRTCLTRPTTVAEHRTHMETVGWRTFYDGLIDMFIFDILLIPSGASRFVLGSLHPLAPPWLRAWNMAVSWFRLLVTGFSPPTPEFHSRADDMQPGMGKWSTGKGFSSNPAILSCQLQVHRYSMFIYLGGEQGGHKHGSPRYSAPPPQE